MARFGTDRKGCSRFRRGCSGVAAAGVSLWLAHVVAGKGGSISPYLAGMKVQLCFHAQSFLQPSVA